MITIYRRTDARLYPYFLIDSPTGTWSGVAPSIPAAIAAFASHPQELTSIAVYSTSREIIEEVSTLDNFIDIYPEYFI